MRITSLSAAFVLALGLGAAACGGDDGYDNQRDALEAILGAFCGAAARCDELPEGVSESECRDMLVDLACAEEDADCDGPLPADVSEEEVDDCVDALDDLACDAEGAPPECGEVPTPETLTALRTRL